MKKCNVSVLLLILSFQLISCGGASSNIDNTDSIQRQPTSSIPTLEVDDEVEDAPDIDEPNSDILEDSVVFAFEDRDNDGIADTEDPEPNQYPNPMSESNNITFDVSTERDTTVSVTLKNTVIAGELVRISLSDLPSMTEKIWIQWAGNGYVYSEPVNFTTSGDISVLAPEFDATRIAIIIDTVISDSQKIAWFPSGSPLIYPVEEILWVNTEVLLSGENLSQLETLKMGDELVDFLPLGDSIVRVLLPENPNNTRLSWSVSENFFRDIQLLLNRNIRLNTADNLQSEGWMFINPYVKKELSTILDLTVKAGIVQQIYLSHPSIDDLLSVIIWPDKNEYYVGAESTLESWLFQQISETDLNSDWLIKRSLIPDVTIAKPEVYQALIKQLNGNQADFYRLYLSWLSEGIPWRTPISSMGIFDDFFANADPDIFKLLITSKASTSRGDSFGKEYSFVAIAQGSSGDCVKLEQTPADLWPSDICVLNKNPIFLSAQVRDSKNNILSTYANSNLNDFIGPSPGGIAGILNTPEVGFLADRSKKSLCKMQSCKVDVLTGGLGLFKETGARDGNAVTLSATEYEIRDKLLFKSVLEKTIKKLLVGTMDEYLPVDDPIIKCLYEKIVVDELINSVTRGYFSKTLNDPNKINSITDINNFFYSDVYKPVVEAYKKYAVDESPDNCSSDQALRAEVKKRVKSKLAEYTIDKLIPEPLKTIISASSRSIAFAIAPEKITFDISPAAVVTSFSTSGDTVNIDDSNGLIRIEGRRLANKLTPNLEENLYFPKIKFRTTGPFGPRTGYFRVQPNHLIESNIADTDIAIPYSELRNSIESLDTGKVKVSLVYDHMTFNGFPDQTVTIPVGEINYSGGFRLDKTDPSRLSVGRQHKLLGNGFELLNDDAFIELNYLNGAGIEESIKISDFEVVNSQTLTFNVPNINIPSDSVVLSVNFSDRLVTLNDPILLSPSSRSQITVFDKGPILDDQIFFLLQNSIEQNFVKNDQGDPYEKLVTPSTKAGTIEWDVNDSDFLLESDNGNDYDYSDPTNPVDVYVKVFCERSTGDDNICTWGIKGTNIKVNPAGLVDPNRFDCGGSLKVGENVLVPLDSFNYSTNAGYTCNF